MPESPGKIALQSRLAYTFRDPSLFVLALTHSSARGASHQRLEFLGDAVLSAVVSELLYRQEPDWDEGALSVARTRYVCKDHLATVARKLDVGSALIVRPEVARSGPIHTLPAVLADTVEALVGAVFVDGGYSAALNFVQRHIVSEAPIAETQDAKTRLQQWCQAKKAPLPQYTLIAQSGPPHQPTFDIECRVPHLSVAARAQASNRKWAEQQAAELVLARLETPHE